MITANELRKKYTDFFISKGHVKIPSASLVPENDSTVLFTTAGMHPLVPYLLGEVHPDGKRVTSVQKCVRTGDIDDVGDNRHLTFFEMLGNWSFGDYFKREAIEWSYEFLTDKKWLGLDPQRIYVTVFKGENGIPRDDEAIKIWREIFSKAGVDALVAGDDEVVNKGIRIIPLGADDNFWIAGASGPCGPDTEMFYDTRPEEGELKGKFSDFIKNFRVIEIWNDVFMEFNKTPEGKYEKLAQQNVDTGMGMERTIAVLNGKENVFDTELFIPIFSKIESLSKKKYSDCKKEFRIIADHVKASVFMISDGVLPSNVERGYILRRLLRRAVRYGRSLDLKDNFLSLIAETIINIYKEAYPDLEENKEKILIEIKNEEDKFIKTLETGLKKLKEYVSGIEKSCTKEISEMLENNKVKFTRIFPAKDAFDLYQSYGFPPELVKEELANYNMSYDKDEFDIEYKKHQDLSRTASSGKFKGGLADSGAETTKYHTATHLLLESLRRVLGANVFQRGSNITAERMRFDFSHSQKMTKEEIQKVEEMVNDKIRNNLPVIMQEMSLEEARKLNAMGVFETKYGQRVKVYTIGDEKTGIFSREICGGPHVDNTRELGRFKIKKEEASSAGVRRIKAVLE